MEDFYSFLREFYSVTTPFYLKTVIVLMATVFPIQTAVAYYKKTILRSYEAILAIIGMVAVIQIYFLLKSYSVHIPPFPFEKIEGPLWQVYVFPLIDLLKGSPFLFKFLDFFYLFVWGISCGVSVVALFTERREARHFFLSLAVCYLVTGVVYLLIRGISPYYLFEEHFRFLSDFAPLSYSLHEASRKATEYLMSTADLMEVVKKIGYPFQPISAFPSFHVSYAYLVSVFVKDYLPKRLKGFCWSFTVAMSVSAVLLGFHWIADVVVGIFVGFISFRLFKKASMFSTSVRHFFFSSRVRLLSRRKSGARKIRQNTRL